MRTVMKLLYLLSFLIISGCAPPPEYQCKDPIGCVAIPPGAPVKIGVVQDLSGSSSVSGNVQLRAVQLALEEHGSMILGHPIELQVKDEGCRVEGGKNAALFFSSQPDLIAVIGTSCSTAAVPASKLLSQKGLVMISGLNSSPSLTSVDGKKGENWYPGYFRTCSNDVFRNITSAEFAFRELGVRKAATIDDGDTYTQGATRMFTRAFTRMGGEVVFSGTIEKGETVMAPVLTSVKHSGAQLLYFPIFAPEALHMIRQVKKMAALDRLTLLGGSALVLESFVRQLGPDGMGIYFESPVLPDGPKLEALVRKYTRKYNETPLSGYYSTAYDATNLLLQAIQKTTKKEKDTLYIGRQALRDTLYATKGFVGATGVLSCDQFGDCGISTVKIVRLDDPSAGGQGLKANVVYVHEEKNDG